MVYQSDQYGRAHFTSLDSVQREGATLGIQTALGKGENLNDIISFLFKEIPKILVQQAFLFVTTLPFEIFI